MLYEVITSSVNSGKTRHSKPTGAVGCAKDGNTPTQHKAMFV